MLHARTKDNEVYHISSFFIFFIFFIFETNVHDFLYVAYNNPYIIFASKREGQSVVGRRFTISAQKRQCKLFFFFF